MWRLGLTGSIASGKSRVLEMFAALGVPVFSADAAVHELYRGEAVQPIAALFPGVAGTGGIDRAALGRQLALSPERLAPLEAIVHPLVRRRVAAFFGAAAAAGSALAVAEVPLLFESAGGYGLDRVALTLADDATLRRRALARPGMSVEKLDAMLARQLPQAEKKARADYLFYTDGPPARTQRAVAALVAALTANRKGRQ